MCIVNSQMNGMGCVRTLNSGGPWAETGRPCRRPSETTVRLNFTFLADFAKVAWPFKPVPSHRGLRKARRPAVHVRIRACPLVAPAVKVPWNNAIPI